MTHFEQRLLTAIEGDSRYDTAELAVRLGVAEAEIVEALMKLEQDGVICGYHTMIDWDKTDVEKVNALIEVRVTPTRGKGFEDILAGVFTHYGLEMNIGQHALVGSTVRSYLAWLADTGRISLEIADNHLMFKAV